jgi:hypothetical protein
VSSNVDVTTAVAAGGDELQALVDAIVPIIKTQPAH